QAGRAVPRRPKQKDGDAGVLRRPGHEGDRRQSQPAARERDPEEDLAVTKEWDAAAYHRLSDPQVSWGEAVLARLALAGEETVLAAGCGTGRLTEKLLERLPRGRVIALDASAQMIAAARENLRRFGDRVSFLERDLLDLDLDAAVDVVFSTATLHWVPDHQKLFALFYRALRPDGRLHAQCGGGPHLRGFLERAAIGAGQPPLTAHLQGSAR